MGLQRGMDGWEPVRPEPLTQVDRRQELRPTTRTAVVAAGTLACPACDAPVAPADGPVGIVAAVECPYCDRRGALREFLSLTTPTRPARVVVRASLRAASALD